jgi:hypothetical protein
MARTTKRSSASGEGEGASDIRANLTKTRIAPDLLATLDTKPPKAAAKAADAKQQMFDVIIEFNRSFPGGMATARLTLLSAYEKARKSAGLAAIAAAAAFAAGQPRDDADLVKAFSPVDTVAIRKSLWTDNFVFARLSMATIQRLSEWTLAVSDPQDPDRAVRNVPLVY